MSQERTWGYYLKNSTYVIYFNDLRLSKHNLRITPEYETIYVG